MYFRRKIRKIGAASHEDGGVDSFFDISIQDSELYAMVKISTKKMMIDKEIRTFCTVTLAGFAPYAATSLMIFLSEVRKQRARKTKGVPSYCP
jgi:hypothetical protein